MKLFKSLMLVGILALGLSFAQTAEAQIFCGPTGACNNDAECTTFDPTFNPFPCPTCFVCNNGMCQPEDGQCDDGTGCTTGICNFDIAFGDLGCQYTSLAPNPAGVPGDLPLECYICEPTANGISIDNGICEPPVENCSNSPDCQIPGETCQTPPPPAQGACDNQPQANVLCADGDRCTDDVCDIPTNTCINTTITQCSPDSDGCCPQGCDGPIQGDANGCRDVTGAPLPNCDADCWFPQDCGDGLVQAPETCDDSADQGNAGINLSGQPVTDEQCRDENTVAECTYCGDGILQPEVEQCDINDTQACGGEGCDLTTCQCNQPVNNVCVTGSGLIDTIRAGCANCSLNPFQVSQGWIRDYGIFILGLAAFLSIALIRRRRSQ